MKKACATCGVRQEKLEMMQSRNSAAAVALEKAIKILQMFTPGSEFVVELKTLLTRVRGNGN